MKNFDYQKIYDFWEKSGFFSADPKSKKKRFSLLIPPPNLTGELHLGHAMQHAILDAIARFRRLSGFDVLLLPGVDHAGIQFEATLDRELKKKNLSKEKLGREKWLDEAWEFKEEIYKSVSKTWRFIGLSADWSREVFTLDDGPRRAVFEAFKTFYEKGLLYKGPYIVQWCPKDNTAIEDVEMEYEERREKLYFLKYGPLTLATVRPETKFGDTAMAVHPKDTRYKKYIGKEFEIETLAGKRKMKVIADDAVDPKFGTGVIKVTPGHDFVDYEIGKRHNLPILQTINKEGRLTDLAGKYAGMKVLEAREAMIDELKVKGILVKVEDYTHNVAVCERCKSIVEPLISEEWFVKVRGLVKGTIEVIDEKKINFFPKNYAKILRDWLVDIHNWCISRSLWWGHRIPVWYCAKCNTQRDPFKKDASIVALDEPNKKCKNCGSGKWTQDEQVLDTWFSSGLWPMSTLRQAQGKLSVGHVDFDPELAKYFPWDFEISAPEIKYLWIARMIMLSKYFTRDIPFKTMFFHGMLRDLQGRKFSKSLGNGIDPNYLIEKWGVDATRMALYTYSIPGRDGRVSREILDERGKNFRNFGTKIRNIARFVLELKPVDPHNTVTASNSEAVSNKIASSTKSPRNDKVDSSRTIRMNKDDMCILDDLDKTTKAVTKHLENLELHLAVDVLYDFVWHKFADKYIESTKERRDSAQPTLGNVLLQVLILLHPFMPFLTEEIYQKFGDKQKSILLERWPSV